MMYDSVRQAKPALRSSFGVGRYNTRLNFYLFESARVAHIQRQSFSYHTELSKRRRESHTTDRFSSKHRRAANNRDLLS
jgi:hypothetical protein